MAAEDRTQTSKTLLLCDECSKLVKHKHVVNTGWCEICDA